MGLSLIRDRLTLVQMSDGGGEAHLVQLRQEGPAPDNLKRALADPERLKIFHFARFDVAMMMRDLGIIPAPIYCTKIASKLARTYTDRHGLKDAVKEMLGRDVSKEQQSSDWGADALTDQQLAYAASDVLHLHDLKAKLDVILAREGRSEIAQSCFDFLPTRAALDLAGWEETDIFAHS
ncbi:MAG: ribonuclease D [Alphaproteobacteria bacterium]|nr:ribonuclease D [Alphaproteobacteria bacterium]